MPKTKPKKKKKGENEKKDAYVHTHTHTRKLRLSMLISGIRFMCSHQAGSILPPNEHEAHSFHHLTEYPMIFSSTDTVHLMHNKSIGAQYTQLHNKSIGAQYTQ